MYETYNSARFSSMSEMTLSDVRAHISEAVQQVQLTGEPVYVTRHGRTVAAIVGASQLEALLQAAEDLADIRAAELAHLEMAATNSEPIPWEQVKADLGLT